MLGGLAWGAGPHSGHQCQDARSPGQPCVGPLRLPRWGLLAEAVHPCSLRLGIQLSWDAQEAWTRSPFSLLPHMNFPKMKSPVLESRARLVHCEATRGLLTYS